MPTKLPKISAYIPLDLYQCLQKDKQKTGMSMSQVIIAALANHYNLEETIRKGGRRVIVGGETSKRITALEKKLDVTWAEIESIKLQLTALENQTLQCRTTNQKRQKITDTTGVIPGL